MSSSERVPLRLSDSKIEGERNVVHQFFSRVLPDMNLVIEASNLKEPDKQAVVDFCDEFINHLEDENYIERVMVSTGPLIPRHGEETPLRRIKLQDGSYNIENSLVVFKEYFDEKFTKRTGEIVEVRKVILSLIIEAFNKQTHP